MGGAKNQMMQEDAQGWAFTDDFVCGRCVDEPALETIVRDGSESERRCSFCEGSPAAPLDVLLGAFFGGLRNEYEHADDGVPYEGGYRWNPIWDTWDLIDEFADIFVGEGLLKSVQEAAKPEVWVESDFITRRRDEALQWSWDRFCKIVKSKTRYVLWLTEAEDLGAGEIPPSEILDQVSKLIDKYELLQPVAAGTRFWRARTHSEPLKRTAKKLGTAPIKKALTANRMSPAGIPKFYGADDADTAICEVIDGTTHKKVTYGQFSISSDVWIVDFTRVPEVPSMFDPKRGAQHREISFLRTFACQISDRVDPEQKEIDYVPTQIVTEYLLHIAPGERPIVGLRYQSSPADGTCVVLDISHKRCVNKETDKLGRLVLHKDTVKTRSVKKLKRIRQQL